MDIRKIEVFNSENNVWIETAFSDLKEEDIVRVFEPDGERMVITNDEGAANVFKITSNIRADYDKQELDMVSHFDFVE